MLQCILLKFYQNTAQGLPFSLYKLDNNRFTKTRSKLSLRDRLHFRRKRSAGIQSCEIHGILYTKYTELLIFQVKNSAFHKPPSLQSVNLYNL